jgi:hypothetical protein
MKIAFILVSVWYASLASAQIMRDDPPSGGTLTRGSNYGDGSSIGQPSENAFPPGERSSPRARQNPYRGSGCNFACDLFDEVDLLNDQSEATEVRNPR